MIVYFAMAFIIFLYGIYIRPNRNQARRKRFVFFSFGLMIILAAIRAPDLGIDLAGHYARFYTYVGNYSWSNIPNFSTFTGYDLGYCYFIKLLSLISTNVRFYIIVTSIILYGVTGYFIYKMSDDVVLSTELFILYCLYYMYMTMLRQGLAICIVLIGYLILRRTKRRVKDYILFAGFIVIGSTFHTSAILCLVMVLFDVLRFTRKQIIGGLVGTAVFYILYERIYSIVLNLLGERGNYDRYLDSVTEGVGNINLQTIICLIITAGAFFLGYYEFVWKRRKRNNIYESKRLAYSMKKEESFLLYMGLMASICRLMIFRMNIINRFSYYFIPFMLVLYPKAINSISNVNNRIMIRRIVYIVFALYFIWMTVKYAGIFYGTVPYRLMMGQ